MADINQIPTELYDLDVTEVSYVGKGAIGEVFTIVKSEEEVIQKIIREEGGKWYVYSEDGSKKLGGPYDDKADAVTRLEQVEHFKQVNKNDVEPLEKGASSDIVKTIQGLSDTEFVSIMEQMIVRYDQINKDEGGNDMDRDQITTLVTEVCTEVIGKSMETVNKNFVAINKSIDELQGKVETVEKAAAAPVKPEDDPKKKPEEDEIKKAIGEVGQAVKTLAETVSIIGKGLEGIPDLQTQVKKMMEETLPGIASRVETIEKQEQPANGLDKGEEEQDVKKSSSRWPSFVRAAE